MVGGGREWSVVTSVRPERGSIDVRWQTVPQTSSCDRKRSVTDSGVGRLHFITMIDNRTPIITFAITLLFLVLQFTSF